MLTHIGACSDLFHTAAGTAFADIMIGGHRETWPIRSKRFRAWLRRRYYQETGEAASAGEIRSALDLLEARAQFDAPECAVHIRVAEHAGHIYLDLADELACRRDWTRRMAGHRMSAGPLPPPGWDVAAAGAAARRVD